MREERRDRKWLKKKKGKEKGDREREREDKREEWVGRGGRE